MNLLARFVAAGCFSVFGLTACATAREEPGQSEAAQNTELSPRTPIAGQEWARCWFAASTSKPGAFDYVCRRTVAPARYPYGFGRLYAYPVSPQTNEVLGSSGDTNTLEKDTSAGIHVMRSGIRRTDFPLDAAGSVDVYTFDDTTSLEATPRITSGEFLHTQRLLAPVGEDHAVVLKQPFDIWPIRVVSFASNGYELNVEKYALNVAPMKLLPIVDGSYGPTTTDVVASLDKFVSFDGTRDVFLPAPAAGSLRATIAPRTVGTGVSGAAVEVTIDGPGVYVYEDNHLRRATAEEMRKLGL